MTHKNIIQGPELNYTIPEKTLGEVLFDCCHQYSNNICQIDGITDQSETYMSVLERSIDVALELKKQDVTSADVIAFCCSNTLDTIIPLLGAAFLGAKVSSLEPCLTEFQTNYLLTLIHPKIIFVEDDSVVKIENVLKLLKNKPKIIKYSNLSQFKSSAEDRNKFVPVAVSLDKTAIILFSSGTNGNPKGVCHSHRSVLRLGYIVLQSKTLTKKVLHVSRFYWITGVFAMVYTFIRGGCRVFCPNSPEDIFYTIEKHQVSSALLSSSLVHKLVQYEGIESTNVSSMKHLLVAGNTLQPTLIQKLAEQLASCKVSQNYGMTESGAVTIFSLADNSSREKLTSSGRIAPGVSLKIVDAETGENLGCNQKGEICIKSTAIFKKLLNNNSINIFDSEGFYKTGDIGYYDEDYCIYIVGRIKEMFKFQGWHIVPSVLEGILLEHPDIVDAAVFGIPHVTDGEKPAACIVTKPNTKITKSDIENLLNDKVTEKERLQGGIWIVESLPRTVTGKVLRQELRAISERNTALTD